MGTVLSRLLDAAVLPIDDDVTVWRKRLITAGAALTPAFLIAVGVVYIVYDEAYSGGLYAGFGVWIWLNLAAFVRVHKNYVLGFWTTAIPVLPVHLLVILSLGDLVHSGAIVLWGLAYPVATGLVFVPWRQIVPLAAVYAINIVATVLIGPADRSRLPHGPEQGILVANLLAQSVFALVIIAVFVNQRHLAYRLLGREQEKVRALLTSILPTEIADELANSPHIIADQYDEVSVLFADVVGFTPLSEGMSPAELVEMLDELFACFDDLVDRAGLEKIKTIGDCYMAAAGVPRPRADHATALVALALQMQQEAAAREFHGRHLQMRIGVNSGPVVAGVIGRRKFSYDLWGDVVNTASRMESHGVAGGVQITDTTHDLIRARFDCIPRGIVDVKGKGALPTWLVTGATQPRRPLPSRPG